MSKKENNELILVSPSGHKYKLSVSDSGNLSTTLVVEEKDEKEA